MTEGTVKPEVPVPRAYTIAEQVTMREMLKAKATIKEIATELGRTKAGVTHHLVANQEKLGYVPPRVPWRERRKAVGQVIKWKHQGKVVAM